MKFNKLILIVFILIIIFNVNVQSTDVCCEQTKSGDSCIYTDRNQCETQNNHQISPYRCEDAFFCVNICCVDSDACYVNTPKTSCLSRNSKVFSDNTCSNVNQCNKGCCTIGDDTTYIQEIQCKSLADKKFGNNYNLNNVFKRISLNECFGQAELQEDGCCVNNGICSTDKKINCAGSFNSGKKCSDINQCNCQKHSYKECNEGNVYWYDSCGNPDELVESCNFDDGKLCTAENGNAFCKSLDCATTTKYENLNYTGGFKKNKESWCVYESPTGNFTDRPGSMQYRFSCINGEEIAEPCGKGFRNEICVQYKEDGFPTARCVQNTVYLEKERNVISSSVSLGFEFWNKKQTDIDKCNFGSTRCTVYYESEDLFDDLDCEKNCYCETPSFIDDSNNYCRTFGDCGTNYNLLNKEGSDGLKVYWSGWDTWGNPDRVSETQMDFLKKFGIYGGMEFFNAYGERLFPRYDEDTRDGGAQKTLNQDVPYFSFNPFIQTLGRLAAYIHDTFTGGDMEYKDVYVECRPWQAPLGGEDCEKCNQDSNKECTEYRCKSLGTTCNLIDLENKYNQCVDVNTNDREKPKLKPLLIKGYSFEENILGYRIKELVEPLEQFTFGIMTNEDSVCKYNLELSKDADAYDNMHFFDDGYFTKDHNMTLFLEGSKDYKYYIRCIDSNGNKNDVDYLIRFKTKKGVDKQAPVIIKTNYFNGQIIPDVNQLSFELELNEPANCKFDIKDNKYGEMKFRTACNDQFSEIPVKYTCKTVLDNFKKGTNSFYFRCQDLAKNNNTNSEKIDLVKSESLVVTVDDITPKEFAYQNDVTLALTTSLGSNNGISICKFSEQDVEFEKMIEFKVTNGINHLHSLVNLKKGNYQYYFTCKDNVGNEASKKIKFKVVLDSSRGNKDILAFYKDSSALYVVLNTESNCEYNNKDFIFGKGIKMGGENTTLHVAPLNLNDYFIRCKDNNGKDVKSVKINI